MTAGLGCRECTSNRRPIFESASHYMPLTTHLSTSLAIIKIKIKRDTSPPATCYWRGERREETGDRREEEGG